MKPLLYPQVTKPPRGRNFEPSWDQQRHPGRLLRLLQLAQHQGIRRWSDNQKVSTWNRTTASRLKQSAVALRQTYAVWPSSSVAQAKIAVAAIRRRPSAAIRWTEIIGEFCELETSS